MASIHFVRLLSRSFLRAIPGLIVALLGLATPAYAQLAVSDLEGGSVDANDLAQSLAGSGVTISNVTFTGDSSAAGSFSGGNGIIGFSDGIILSSGAATSVPGPNNDDGITTDHSLPGDPDLTALAGFDTSDAAVLEFDFVPQGGTVSFLYVFSSDEYNEFVDSEFNDVFGFFVNGTNCALVGSDPVSINTINNDNPFGGPTPTRPELYINNDPSDGGGSLNTEMDGLTTVLSCQANVNSGVTNHMKLAIADASDGILDSNVFIQAGSLSVCTPGTEVCNGVDDDCDGVVDNGLVCGGPIGNPNISGAGCSFASRRPDAPVALSMLFLALGLPLAVFRYLRAR